MPGALVFSENALVAAELLTGARALGTPVWLAALGPAASAAAEAGLAYGAERVYVNHDAALAEVQADTYAMALEAIVEASGASLVVLGSTRRGKELAGRLAQRLACGAVTDAIGLEAGAGGLTVRRYALGGNTVATDRIESGRQVVSVVPHSYEAVPSAAAGEVIPVTSRLSATRAIVVARAPKAAATADIERAEKLVAIGKGLAKGEDLALVEDLAAAIGAEIGCTRALAADYHWMGEERIIGISGKITKPRLMVSIGISGQIQHTVGILGAKVIVAVNKDKSAPIFKIADYGIVGDLYQVVPRLAARLRQTRA